MSKIVAERVSDLATRLGLTQVGVASFMKLDINRFNRLRRGEGTATHKELLLLLEVELDLEKIDKQLDAYGERKAYLEKL